MGDVQVITKIGIEGIEIGQVRTFQYLRVRINEKRTQDAEINERIEETIKLYYSMRNNFINKTEISS